MSAIEVASYVAGAVFGGIVLAFAVVLVACVTKFAAFRARLAPLFKTSFMSLGTGPRALINSESFYYQRIGEYGRFVSSVAVLASHVFRHGIIVAAVRVRGPVPKVAIDGGMPCVVVAVLGLLLRRLTSHWLLARGIDVVVDVFLMLFGILGSNLILSNTDPTTTMDGTSTETTTTTTTAASTFAATLPTVQSGDPAAYATFGLLGGALLFRLCFIRSRSCDIEPTATLADVVTFHLMAAFAAAVVVFEANEGFQFVDSEVDARQMAGAVAYGLAMTDTVATAVAIHRFVVTNQSLRLMTLLVFAFDAAMWFLVFVNMIFEKSILFVEMITPGRFAGAFVAIAFAVVHVIVRLVSMFSFDAPARRVAPASVRAPPLSVMPPKQPVAVAAQQPQATPTPTPAPAKASSESELRHFDSARSDIMVGASGQFDSLTPTDEIDPVELRDMVECGKGSFGIVYRATYRHSEVAVKSINETAFGGDTDIVTEARTLAALPTHANVVAFRGHCRLQSGRPAIVLEFCEGGSLLAALRSADVRWTTEKQIKVASGTAAGLAHLHKCGIVHRDIAARNVLLASLESMVAKVTDFGMSKAQAEADSTLSSFGSAAWMAPEQLQSTRADGKFTFSMASDVFAFGVLLFEVFERKTPWAGYQLIDIRDRVAKGKRVEFDPKLYPTDVLDLMDNCWNFLPAQRPGMDAIAATLVAKRKNLTDSATPATITTSQTAASTTIPSRSDEYDDSAPLPSLPPLPQTPLDRNEYDQSAPTTN
jgi:hypothetical protein